MSMKYSQMFYIVIISHCKL